MLETTTKEANNIISFFGANNLVNNPDKAALLYNSKGKEKQMELEVGGEVLRTKDSEKLLGLHINPDLNWNTHVSKLCTTLKQRIGLLKRIKYKIKLVGQICIE